MSESVIFDAKPGGSLHGAVRVPGDKSISHRAIMLGSIAEGMTHVSGFLEAEDSLATLKAFRAMGVRVDGPDAGEVHIHGVGLHGLTAPEHALNLGNSGTSMRLLSGLLAGQAFDSTLTGDRSLCRRPMTRVMAPLRQMGAEIRTMETGTAPLTLAGTARLSAIDYTLPVASAQVKSCLLMAGLYAQGETCITEPAPTRDHTERMLEGFSYPVRRSGRCVCVAGGGVLKATEVDVPGDISSAAFFLVGASIAAQSGMTLQHIGINPTRTGIIDILRLMGANIEVVKQGLAGGEPVADLHVRSARLKGIRIPEQLVPLAIDEFPVLFIAAACADGETMLTGAAELRVKESDRIQVMAEGLETLGIEARPTPDGIVIKGGSLAGGCVDSHGDHRIAMAFSIAAARADAPITVLDCENVNTSFPGFADLASNCGLDIQSRRGVNA